MIEYPQSPLTCPYSQSVYAAYSSACVVLSDVRERFYMSPELWVRIWVLWSFAFTAAVSLVFTREIAINSIRRQLWAQSPLEALIWV